MALTLLLLSDLFLLAIFVQDLRYRAVSWYLFPACVLSIGAGIFLTGTNHRQWQFSLLANLGFLLLNLLLLALWFWAKKISPKTLVKEYIGAGDFLLFAVMALALPFPAFPILFIGSLLTALLAGLLLFKNTTVPLAGLQALFLALILTLDFAGITAIRQLNFLGL